MRTQLAPFHTQDQNSFQQPECSSLSSSEAPLWALSNITPAMKINKSEYQKQRESLRCSLSTSQGPATAKGISLPNLAVGRWCLCDDRAGLGRRHGLLNHNAGVVVGHPSAAKLVSSGPCYGPADCIMH